jgi:hypothetical protein
MEGRLVLLAAVRAAQALRLGEGRMKRSIVNNHEVLSDGRRVWVNGPDGASVARYSPMAGRDVHRPLEEQRTTGKECLDCSPDTDYDAFVASVHRHYGVVIPSKHRPLVAEPEMDEAMEAAWDDETPLTEEDLGRIERAHQRVMQAVRKAGPPTVS